VKELEKQPKPELPKREKITRAEALERMKSFPKRREKFVAAVRKGALEILIP
jgi:hypothetical protein